jgi:hypothetical protein
MSSADREHLLTLLAEQGHAPAAAHALFEGLEGTRKQQTAVSGPPRASRRREKLFGVGRPRALDRNAKVRIMHWARCLSRRTEKGRAYGVVTAKAVAVLEALLWAFHNAKSGLCFPSYERIAEAASCARSTVAEALKGGQNKSSAKSYAKGERSMNCAVVRKPRHPIPVDCHRIGPDLISSPARLDNSPGRLVVCGVGRWVNGNFSRLKID